MYKKCKCISDPMEIVSDRSMKSCTLTITANNVMYIVLFFHQVRVDFSACFFPDADDGTSEDDLLCERALYGMQQSLIVNS